MINPSITIDHKEWDISEYAYYGGNKILLVDSPTNEQEKFLEAIIAARPEVYSWDYSDSAYIDIEDDCAYSINDYGESEFILTDSEVLGKRRFDSGELTFDDIAEEYIDNPEKAIPSWLNLPKEWEEQTCELQYGWYGRNDDPSTILANAPDDLSIVFKIRGINPFAVDYCVYTKQNCT